MAVDFCDYFWGEEHNGWNVLYQNMRLGQTATKELTDFFKERWSIDETYAKSLNKLAQRVGGGQGAVSGNVIGNVERWGSFAPVFGVLRAACEQLASVHLSVVAKLQDLVKELNKYQEQMHRKHKQVKDEESHTEDLVKTIQTTSILAQKAKENYSQRCQDLERVRREGASPKDLEKAEAKLRKSYDEYKHLLDKYNNIREDFEKCMTVSCKRFQEVEDQHLTRLLHSVREFVRVLGSSSEAVAQIQHDMHRHFSKHSVLSLLDAFALNKYTGLEKPNVMVFEDCGSVGSGVLGPDQQSPELGSNARAQSSSSLQQPDQQSSKSSAEEIPSAGGGGGGVLAGGMASVSTPLERGLGQSVSRRPPCNLVPSEPPSVGRGVQGGFARGLGVELSSSGGNSSVCDVSGVCSAELPSGGGVCEACGGVCGKGKCGVGEPDDRTEAATDVTRLGVAQETCGLPLKSEPRGSCVMTTKFTEGPYMTNEVIMLRRCNELTCDKYGYFSQCSHKILLPAGTALLEDDASHVVCRAHVDVSGSGKSEQLDIAMRGQSLQGTSFGTSDVKNISLANKDAEAMLSDEASVSDVWFDARFEELSPSAVRESKDLGDECAEVSQLFSTPEKQEDLKPISREESRSRASREGELETAIRKKPSSLSSPAEALENLSCCQGQSGVSPKRSAARKSVWRTHMRPDRDSVIGGLSLFLRKSKSPEPRGTSGANTKAMPLLSASSSSSTFENDAEENASALEKPACKEARHPKEPGSEVSITTSPTTGDEGRTANSVGSPHRSRLGSIASALSAARFSKGSRDARKKGKENKILEHVAPVSKPTKAEVLAERSPPNESKPEHLPASRSAHQECVNVSGKGAIKREKGSYPTFRFSKSKKDSKRTKDSKSVKQGQETTKAATSKKEAPDSEKNINILSSIPINFREWRLSKSPTKQEEAEGGTSPSPHLQDGGPNETRDVVRSLVTAGNSGSLRWVASCGDGKRDRDGGGRRYSYGNERLQQECNGKPLNISAKLAVQEGSSGEIDFDLPEINSGAASERQVSTPSVSLGPLYQENKCTIRVSSCHPYRASADDAKIRAYSAKMDDHSPVGVMSSSTLVLQSTPNHATSTSLRIARLGDPHVEPSEGASPMPAKDFGGCDSNGTNLHRRQSVSLQHLSNAGEGSELVESSPSGVNLSMSVTHIPLELSHDGHRGRGTSYSRILPRTQVILGTRDTSLDVAESPPGNESLRGNLSFHSSYLDLYVSPKGELMSLSEKRTRRRLSAEVSIESLSLAHAVTVDHGHKHVNSLSCHFNRDRVSNEPCCIDSALKVTWEVGLAAEESPTPEFGVGLKQLPCRDLSNKSKTEKCATILSKTGDASDDASVALVSSDADEKLVGADCGCEAVVSVDEPSSPVLGGFASQYQECLPSEVPDSIIPSSSPPLPDPDSGLVHLPDSRSAGCFLTSSPGIAAGSHFDHTDIDVSLVPDALRGGDCDRDSVHGNEYESSVTRGNECDCDSVCGSCHESSVPRGNDCDRGDLCCGSENCDCAVVVQKRDDDDCNCVSSSCDTCGFNVLDVSSVECSNEYRTCYEDVEEPTNIHGPESPSATGQQASPLLQIKTPSSEQFSLQMADVDEGPIIADLPLDEHPIKDSLYEGQSMTSSGLQRAFEAQPMTSLGLQRAFEGQPMTSPGLRRAVSCGELWGKSGELQPPVPFRRAVNRSLPALPRHHGKLLPPPPPLPARLSLRKGKPPASVPENQRALKSKPSTPAGAEHLVLQPPPCVPTSVEDQQLELRQSTAVKAKDSGNKSHTQPSLAGVQTSKHSKPVSEHTSEEKVVEDSGVGTRHSGVQLPLAGGCDQHSTHAPPREAPIEHSATSTSPKPCDNHLASASGEPDQRGVSAAGACHESAPTSVGASAHPLLPVSSAGESGSSSAYTGADGLLKTSSNAGTGACVVETASECVSSGSRANLATVFETNRGVDAIHMDPDEAEVLSVSGNSDVMFVSSTDLVEKTNTSSSPSLKDEELGGQGCQTRAESGEPENVSGSTCSDANESSRSSENFGSVSESSLAVAVEPVHSVIQAPAAQSTALATQEIKLPPGTSSSQSLEPSSAGKAVVRLEPISVPVTSAIPSDSEEDNMKIDYPVLESTTRDVTHVSAATSNSDENEDRFLDAFGDWDELQPKKKTGINSEDWLNFDGHVDVDSHTRTGMESSVSSPGTSQRTDENRHSPALFPKSTCKDQSAKVRIEAHESSFPGDGFTGRFPDNDPPDGGLNNLSAGPPAVQNDPWSSNSSFRDGGAESSVQAKCSGFTFDEEDPWADAKLNFEGQFSQSSCKDGADNPSSFHEEASSTKEQSMKSATDTPNIDYDDDGAEVVSELSEGDTETAVAAAAAVSTSPKHRNFWPFKQHPKQPSGDKAAQVQPNPKLTSISVKQKQVSDKQAKTAQKLLHATHKRPPFVGHSNVREEEGDQISGALVSSGVLLRASLPSGSSSTSALPVSSSLPSQSTSILSPSSGSITPAKPKLQLRFSDNFECTTTSESAARPEQPLDAFPSDLALWSSSSPPPASSSLPASVTAPSSSSSGTFTPSTCASLSSPTVVKTTDSIFWDLKPTPKTDAVSKKDASGRETPVEDVRCASPASADSLSRSILARSSKWFLRSRRDRKKEKKNKKKKDGADTTSNKEERSDNECSEEARTTELVCVRSDDGEHQTDASYGGGLLGGDAVPPLDGNNVSVSSSGSGAVAAVDEEGYSVRPHDASHTQLSSSDSDSDDDFERPIHVSIKPISNGAPPPAASVDQLRATIQNMTLGAPLPTNRRVGALSADPLEGGLRRSSSATNTTRSSSADLLGLNLNFGASPVGPPAGGAGPTSPSVTATSADRPPQDGFDFPSRTPPVGGGATSPPPMLPPRGSTPTPTSTIPRPLSRRNIDARGRSHSPALSSALSRAESASSLDWRSPPAGGPVGGSRGPSPLTLGYTDTIPLAIAFQELCHVYFRGTDESRCQVKVTGEVMVSFPAGIVSVLTTRPQPSSPLSFTLTNTGLCDQVLPNTQLIERCSVEEHSYNFLMPALTALLRQQADHNPSASYFNVDIVKYQVSSLRGAQCTPLQLVSYWKCSEEVTELRVDYRYNPAAALPAPQPLLNLTLSTVVDGAVKTMHSKPQGQWIKEQQKAVWKLPELSPQSSQQSGTLRAKFEVAVGPSTPSTVSAMFTCEAATITGMDFSLNGPGYRLSLVKKRFVSGKYICDADAVLRLRYGTGAS